MFTYQQQLAKCEDTTDNYSNIWRNSVWTITDYEELFEDIDIGHIIQSQEDNYFIINPDWEKYPDGRLTRDNDFDLSHCVNCRINRSLSSCVCETEDTEEDEHEWDYCNYGTEQNPRFGSVSYQVAGGGMMNGNAYATIELKDGFYWYCEYGKNANKKKVGTKIVWSDEIYDKKNPYECRNFDITD